AIFRHLADSLGGIIDQQRGSYDPERTAVAHIQTIMALHGRFKADALLYWVIQESGQEWRDLLTVRIEDSEGHTVYEQDADIGPQVSASEIVRDRPRCAAAVEAVLGPFCKATLRQ
ncbi:MAG TPA: hypothetical protein VK527_11835, partial [Candidatus Limnocylindrales bacterium]|nr:hypothetical protein [Candidatus Limnocylindrales bacterium]